MKNVYFNKSTKIIKINKEKSISFMKYDVELQQKVFKFLR